MLEDVPGTGKTVLAKTLAKSMGCQFDRVQFTPDLLPTDVTGLSFFNQEKGCFTFKEGPVFTNVLLADEINRATPRTQSSLLECMAERQVTVDGVTRALSDVYKRQIISSFLAQNGNLSCDSLSAKYCKNISFIDIIADIGILCIPKDQFLSCMETHFQNRQRQLLTIGNDLGQFHLLSCIYRCSVKV